MNAPDLRDQGTGSSDQHKYGRSSSSGGHFGHSSPTDWPAATPYSRGVFKPRQTEGEELKKVLTLLPLPLPLPSAIAICTSCRLVAETASRRTALASPSRIPIDGEFEASGMARCEVNSVQTRTVLAMYWTIKICGGGDG
jgi:hypothetical protein